jgi:hypothetical protein
MADKKDHTDSLTYCNAQNMYRMCEDVTSAALRYGHVDDGS